MPRFNHARIERSTSLLFILTLMVISIGGLVEIVPLFKVESTVKPVEGVRPYTPLEQAGRDIYVREGCYNCHSQMIRSLRDEVERYGHYSLAAESMYDHPFQWGSKRTGPDLARVGGKYSDGWHVQHMHSPRSVVPESVMPGYPFLAGRKLDYKQISEHMEALKITGVPYSEEMIKAGPADIVAQISPDTKEAEALVARYPKAQVRKFDGGQGTEPTELDALIAYLQMLGTLVDFADFDAAGPNLR